MPAWTWRAVFFTPAFRSLLAACGAHASGGTGLLWRDRANPGAPTLSLAYPQTVHNPSSNRKTDTGLCRETTTTNVTGSRFIGDRKSTRLNSSHLVISYAVFCLKKKKHYSSVYSH